MKFIGNVFLLFMFVLFESDSFRAPMGIKLKLPSKKLFSRGSESKQKIHTCFQKHSFLLSAESNIEENEGFNAAAWLNPNTRGGVIVWSIILTILPVGFYNFLVGNTGIDESKAGVYVGVGFVVLSMVGWALTYLFRVANKDMTYAKQLRDYENAVLQKR